MYQKKQFVLHEKGIGMASFPSEPEKKAQPKSMWLKRPMLTLPLLCLLILGTAVGARLIGNATNAGAASLALIKGHVPALVKVSTVTGPTDPNQSISLSVGLQLRNTSALQAFANNTVRSRSTRKIQHLTPDQIAQAFAPLASSQQSVIDYLQSYGFHVTMTLSQHLIIGFQGTIGDAENAFHLQIENYTSPTGQRFYAPSNEPSVPANLAGLIQNIAGLDNVRHFSHPPVRYSKNTSSVTALTVTCLPEQTPTPGQSVYVLPAQLASAYNLTALYNAGFRGEGENVALIEFDDFNSSDVSNFTHCYGGSSVPINKIKVDGGNGGNGAPPGAGAVEAELDMDEILSAAPHLASLNVYEAPNSDTGSLDMWGKIISGDAVPVVSTSWGGCEQPTQGVTPATLQEENTLFTLAAAQGQTIVAASGDNGTDDCSIPLNSPKPVPHLAVDDPASQPFVTGVGGTSLILNSNNSYGSETVWNNGVGQDAFGNPIVFAGGGGISNVWTMPAWQQGPGVSNSFTTGTLCNATSGTFCREVPDVSLSADPNNGAAFPIFCSVTAAGCSPSGWYPLGGTSAAAPMWAAFVALANQKTLHDGGFNIGFLNPLLYQIDQNAGGTSYTNDFHDTTVGNNDGLNDGQNVYPATANYDMTTGLGSYNAGNLAQDLEKLAIAQNGSRGAPAATTWYFAEGAVGGSYKEFLTILNPSTLPAQVNVEYFFQGGKPPVTIPHTIAANTRFTITVNNDLGVANTATLEVHSTVVTSVAANGNPAVPIVVERPLYFNAHGVAGGTDVQGATSTGTSFFFAAGDSSSSSQEFIELLNPGTTAANVTISYLSGGSVVETDHIAVAAQARGTTNPTFHGHTAIAVTSDQPIVVERTEYFSGSVTNAGGQTTGASSTMGVTTQGTDWLFAEGYTGTDFQENLVLANFGSSATTATIRLEYTNGTVQTVQQTVNGQSQLIFDVNNANAHPNSHGIRNE